MTGIAAVEKGEVIDLASLHHNYAFDYVETIIAMSSGNGIHIVIEDARLRKWFGNAKDKDQKKINAKKQGAGAIKVICGFWEEWAKTVVGSRVYCDFVKPYPTSSLKKAGIEVNADGKITMEGFRQFTGYKGKRCCQHPRDAGVIAFTYNPKLANVSRLS